MEPNNQPSENPASTPKKKTKRSLGKIAAVAGALGTAAVMLIPEIRSSRPGADVEDVSIGREVHTAGRIFVSANIADNGSIDLEAKTISALPPNKRFRITFIVKNRSGKDVELYTELLTQRLERGNESPTEGISFRGKHILPENMRFRVDEVQGNGGPSTSDVQIVRNVIPETLIPFNHFGDGLSVEIQ